MQLAVARALQNLASASRMKEFPMRFAAALIVFALGLPVVALAVTPEELARLRAAGLGDQVLLALVDTTGVQGRMGADEAMDLARAGVGDRVIAAAIRRAAADEARALLPPEPVVEQTASPDIAPPPELPVLTQVVPVPVVPWVAVPVFVHRPHGPAKPTLGDYRGPGRFINTDLRPLNNGFVEPPQTRETRGSPPR
jgi:hypothetical protein